MESLWDYVKVYTKSVEFEVKYSLTAFLELPDDRFLRVHRSFVVNTEAVTAYAKHDIENGPVEIPIGDMCRQSVALSLE